MCLPTISELVLVVLVKLEACQAAERKQGRVRCVLASEGPASQMSPSAVLLPRANQHLILSQQTFPFKELGPSLFELLGRKKAPQTRAAQY